MKIESSVVAMNSAREYESIEFTRIKSSEVKWEQGESEGSQDKLTKEDALTQALSQTKKLLSDENPSGPSESANAGTGNTVLAAGKTTSSPFSVPDREDLKLTLLRKMLDMLLGSRHSTSSYSALSVQQAQASAQSFSLNLTSSPTPIKPLSGSWVRNVEAVHFLSEKESTVFSTVGVAKTQDGRELTFNLDLEMSRSFMQYSSIEWSEQVVMKDPLVINLNSNPASLSDQKFCFDIDSDGKEDNISYLNKDSGYLALDKNGDGKINNGKELFGANTGNGFAELSSYDLDKNGWIDENDEIFNKLKIWIKSDDGTDKMITLKDADIGAIYLGSTETDFLLRSGNTGQVNGQIVRTGVYLKNSTGEAGTAQQIDVSV